MLKITLLSAEELNRVAAANKISVLDIDTQTWPTDINDGTSYAISERDCQRLRVVEILGGLEPSQGFKEYTGQV